MKASVIMALNLSIAVGLASCGGANGNSASAETKNTICVSQGAIMYKAASVVADEAADALATLQAKITGQFIPACVKALDGSACSDADIASYQSIASCFTAGQAGATTLSKVQALAVSCKKPVYQSCGELIIDAAKSVK